MIRPLVIRAPEVNAKTARADWEGRTDRARFEGAREADKRPQFGRKVTR